MLRVKQLLKHPLPSTFQTKSTLPLSRPFSPSTTISSLLATSQPSQALSHHRPPDRFTLPSLLNLSLHLTHPSLQCDSLHSFSLRSGHLSDPFISTALITTHLLSRRLDAARHLFAETPRRDVVLFTALISGFSRNSLPIQALDFFSIMLNDKIEPNRMTISTVLSVCSQLRRLALGKTLHGFSLRRGILDATDVILHTALLDMYAKCGELRYVKRVFERMSGRNLVSWNVIIGACVSSGLFGMALEMFRDMVLEGWGWPRSSTLASVLKACGVTTDLRKGKEIHGYVLKSMDGSRDLDCLVVGNAIVDMYVNTGSFRSAVLVFESMPERNLVTWTTMISGYGAHGFSLKALDAFNAMEKSGIRPDGVAFLAVLSACSHGGLVDEGRELYLSMKREYNIVPEIKHFVCMVDLYGRAGLLGDAFDFIKAMPVEPSKFVWGALLSCCRNHKNVELGEYAAKKALQLDKHDVGNYVLLSRLYADAGRWNDVAKVRLIMKELGLKPDTACSWVELKGRVYRFTVGDQLNAFSKKMYELLGNLGLPIKKGAGHKIDEEQTRDLCCHTEKLALAFMLMKHGGGGLIRIWKNLRVCGDCHESFKYISMISNREIILKDPNRYHRFERGCCSCCDHW